MIPFAALEDLASQTLLNLFGEEAVVQPQIRGGYGPEAADPERAPMRIFGILATDTRPRTLMQGRTGGEARTSMSMMGDTPRFWIAACALCQGFDPRPGDRLELPHRGRSLTIVSIDRGLHGDVWLTLAGTEDG